MKTSEESDLHLYLGDIMKRKKFSKNAANAAQSKSMAYKRQI